MQTVFSWGKFIKKTILYASFVVLLTCLTYAHAIQNAVVVSIGERFVFVVKDCENIEVGVFETQQIGGAGYTWSEEDNVYISVGVYSTVSQAERVAETLGEEYQVKVMMPNDLYFTTSTQKRMADMYKGAFSSLDGCMQVLSQEINRMERGATQQSTKRILNEVQRQFRYLQQEYEISYPSYAAVCKNAEEQLGLMTEDIVYASKLRYLLCELSVAYCQLASRFLP